MSFSSLVSDIAYRKDADRNDDKQSQLHGGYSHPLARAWQAERQLTKVSIAQYIPLRACGR
jgi:porphobilinogen synthase